LSKRGGGEARRCALRRRGRICGMLVVAACGASAPRAHSWRHFSGSEQMGDGLGQTGDSGGRRFSEPDSSVVDWLLDSDPAIRWQVLRDLLQAPADTVALERARVAMEGVGARLLALQG